MSSLRLNEVQAAAVSSRADALVVVAGAGSGKTEVVAQRIERLLVESEQDPFKILAVSYTEKAADELRQRLADRSPHAFDRVTASTIHGFALDLLRDYGTRIGLPKDPEVLTRNEDRAELLLSWLADSGITIDSEMDQIFASMDLARARCEDAEFLSDWRDALAAIGGVDYPAMLDRAIELLDNTWVKRTMRFAYRHVMVDEAQNLSRAQYAFLKKFIGPPEAGHLSAMFVGDDRQSIVSFAGADSAIISSFERDYHAKRIELTMNYRSADRIVDLGREVARSLGRPVESGTQYSARGEVLTRTWNSERSEGKGIADWVSAILDVGLPSEILAPGELARVQKEEIAVLARAGSHLGQVRAALEERDIPYASGSSQDDWLTSTRGSLLAQVIAYKSAPDHVGPRRRLAKILGRPLEPFRSDIAEALAASDSLEVSSLAELSVLSDVSRFIEQAIELADGDPNWISDLSEVESAWRSFVSSTSVRDRTFGNFYHHVQRRQRGDRLAPGVRLFTIHKAQGREFKAVAIVGLNQGQFPDFRATSAKAKQDELRAFYVAVSRASRSLMLSRARSRPTKFGQRQTDPSPFFNLARNLE